MKSKNEHGQQGAETTGDRLRTDNVSSGQENLPEIMKKTPCCVYQFILRKDGSMALPYASEGVCNLFRIDHNDVRDDASTLFDTIHPEDRGHILTSIQVSAENLSPWQQVFRVRFADGAQSRLFAQAVPEKRRDETVEWCGFVVDISDFLKNHEEMTTATLESEIEWKIKSQLLSTIAQEFRAPLSLLASSTDILGRYGSRLPEAKLEEQHQNIIASTRKFSELLETMMDFCRFDPDTAMDGSMLIDFAKVVEEIVAEFRKNYGSTYRFHVSISPDCGKVFLDEAELRRLLGNLLKNAFRFTLPGGKVTLKVWREKKCLLLELTDSGIGIPPEDRLRVFEPFQCGRNAGAMKGLGLGLSIVRAVIAKLEGTIVLDGKVGEGTSVRVEIPVRQYADTLSRQNHYSILIVEDDLLLCGNMELILQMEGYEVRTAPNGIAALALIAIKRPDIILCDIIMPEMDGHVLLEEIKKNDALSDIIFIFVTALGEKSDMRRGMHAGADDYLTKPFSSEDLLATVSGRLQKSEGMRRRPANTTTSAEREILSTRVSDREREVLILVGKGETTKEIAEQLYISPKTVEGHRTKLMKKLGVVNAVGLARWATIAEEMKQHPHLLSGD
jgi:signal transduction histidine kinase/DNA-binding NarL/FixJ family response regulator